MENVTFIEVKSPPKDLVNFLYHHFSFSKSSMISEYSKLYIRSPNPTKVKFHIVFVIHKLKIVGYGLITENLARYNKGFNYKDIFKSKTLLLMLYVDKKYRKLGLASEMFKKLIAMNPANETIVIAHDEVSNSFFRKFKRKYKTKLKIIDWVS